MGKRQFYDIGVLRYSGLLPGARSNVRRAAKLIVMIFVKRTGSGRFEVRLRSARRIFLTGHFEESA
jgi:hypothetical protein